MSILVSTLLNPGNFARSSRYLTFAFALAVAGFGADRTVYVRDLGISDYPNWPTSPFLKETAEKWGAPELAQNYVGAMEMTAGIRLLQYLEKDGHQVRLTESRRFPAEAFATQ